jgi:Protein of unknown function (DUF2891)
MDSAAVGHCLEEEMGRSMKVFSAGLIVSLMISSALFGQSVDAKKVVEYLKTLPAVTPPVFDAAKRETLAVSAISCADHPEEAPANRNNYLWQYSKPPQLLDGYDKNRSFYGCADWHSAVGSVWALMSLMKQDPKISVGSDIKDIATNHFKKPNMDGELAFFNEQKGPDANFEKPYGYAWLLKLYGEVKGSNSEDDKKLATALMPLAKWMSERYVFYLYDLKYPYRTGVESNTAWGMSLALDGANLSEDTTLKTAIQANAIRLFEKDKNCATNFEPQNTDLVSSCLTEAALMGRVMDQQSYLKWLDGFLPPVYSDAFEVYAKDGDISHTNTTGPDAQIQLAAESRLIGLNFQRAADLVVITYALPKDDPRIAVFKQLAVINAKHGYDKIGSAGYEGQHWLSTFALLYENAMKGPAPLAPPEKPKGKADEAGGS